MPSSDLDSGSMIAAPATDDVLATSITGLRVTAVTRGQDGAVCWSRWPGVAVPGPLSTVRLAPRSAAEDVSTVEHFTLVAGVPVGHGVAYRLRGHVTVAERVSAAGGRPSPPELAASAALLHAVGRAAAAIPARVPVPAVRGPAGADRLRRRLNGAATSTWPPPALDPERLRILRGWLDAVEDRTGPAVHGALSLGAVVIVPAAGRQRHQVPSVEVLIGEDVGPGRAEWDLGTVVGDLLELLHSGPGRAAAPDVGSAFVPAVTALLEGHRCAGGAPVDLDLLGRSAVLRTVLHLGDRLEHAGGHPDRQWVDRIGALVDQLTRDGAARALLGVVAEQIDTGSGSGAGDAGHGQDVARPAVRADREPMRFRAPGLHDHPEVDRLLRDAGFGTLLPADLHSLGGRNDNWIGTTSLGRPVMVKRVLSPAAIDRSLAYEALARTAAFRHLRTPELLAQQRSDGLLVFALLPSATPLLDLSLAGRFDPVLGEAAGRAVAELHRATPDLDLEQSMPVMPPVGWLDGLPWSAVQQFSMAQLWAWKAIQDDRPVVEALRVLRRDEASARWRPIHADLRLDQWITSGGQLHLCDWEEFRSGDPARDLGTLVGEIVHHAVVGLFTAGDQADPGTPLSHQEILVRGRRSLAATQPTLRALWAGYDPGSFADPELADRAARFAGWHLFDRFLAAAEGQNVVNPVAKAGAGIGRSVLLEPAGLLDLLEES